MTQKNKTSFFQRDEAEKHKKWLIFDASGKTLGRFASEVAKVLRGKHKPQFTPNADLGDGVIVIHADKIKVSGQKEAQKKYFKYTGFMGGLRETPYRVMKDQKPEYIITHAVQGMMPKTKLGKQQLKHLRVFAGENHNMQAQKPLKVEI
jgi:large subunit ribosomal protein L13